MTAGYNDRVCTNGKGGIKSVIIFPISKIINSAVVSNQITTLTVSGETFRYKLKSNLSSYTAPIKVNKDNGTLFYEESLSMILASDTKELRAQLHLLAQNLVVALVENADGSIVALGFGEGLQVADANEYTSGVTKGDRKGHVIVLNGMENEPVPDVTAAIFATLSGQQSPSV